MTITGHDAGGQVRWDDISLDHKKRFVNSALRDMQKTEDKTARGEGIGTLVYLVLGRWTETVKPGSLPRALGEGGKSIKSAATRPQLDAMKEGVRLLAECGGIPLVWDAMRSAFEPFWYVVPIAARLVRA